MSQENDGEKELKVLLQKFDVAREKMSIDELVRLEYLLIHTKLAEDDGRTLMKILLAGGVSSFIKSLPSR